MDHMLPPEEDADIPVFCRALGVPGLADIHTHFLPPRMLRRVWEYFDQSGPLVGVSWPIRYKWDDGERVAHLRSMGVRMFSAQAYAGAPDYDAFLRLAADHERVALDTTMIFTDFFDKLAPFPAAALPLARDLGLAGKVLLGSDFPNIPYPYARQIGGLVRLSLGDAWLRAVCWENPVALFGGELQG